MLTPIQFICNIMIKGLPKVLVVDDEQDILELIRHSLAKEGFEVHIAANGAQAVEQAKKVKPEIIIMDVMMPVMDGMEACRQLKEIPETKNIPVIFLTARSEEFAELAGFEAGADDYISKPIRPRLLISKIESLLRRINPERTTEEEHESAGIVIDREKFVVVVNNKELQLPKKEFELLELLASRPGKVFNREQILTIVWGNETIVGERTIDVHIRKLREKLGESYIRTIKGVGYTFNRK